MKNQLLCLLLFFIGYQSAFGQNDNDKQWLIMNEKGKEGLDAAGNNKYINEMTNQFILENIKHPNTNIQGARNDIFVIYKDGKHFNPRPLPKEEFFYPGADFQTDVNHNFSSNHSSQIGWLYLTNRYEEDDPPELVHAKKSTTPAAIVHKFDVTDSYASGPLQVNHDVTRSKDITLIIDQEALIPGIGINPGLWVRFDSLIPLKTGLTPVWSPSFFDLRPVFKISGQNFAAFPLSTCNTGGGPINLPLKYIPDSTFTYINLKLKNISDQFMPDRDGSPRYAAVFKVVGGHQEIVARITQPILNSSDPNFIKVDSICHNRDDQIQMVYYTIQFRNTSKTNVASGIEVKFSFPNAFLTSCFEMIEWSPNSTANEFNIFNNGVYHFTFDPDSTLSICPESEDKNSCTGFLKFKIAVPDSYDLSDGARSLELINPITIFDKMPYAITDFRDILEPNKENWIRVVKEGDCKCKKPPCIPCILAAIGAVIAIGIFILRRRRRR